MISRLSRRLITKYGYRVSAINSNRKILLNQPSIDRKVEDLFVKNYSTLNDPLIIPSQLSDITIPNVTLTEYIWEFLDLWKNKIAIECAVTGRHFTFLQVRNDSKQIASSLLALRMKPNDVVLLALPNIPEFPAIFFGIIESGLIVTTINPNHTFQEFTHLVKLANPRIIICHPSNLSNILGVKNNLKTNIKIIVTNDFNGKYKEVPSDVVPLETLLINKNNSKLLPLDIGNQKINTTATKLILFSSGTTGFPKGVCLTHRCLIASEEQCDHPEIRVVNRANDEQVVLPAVLPFFHTYAITQILIQGLRKGSKIISLPYFTPEAYLDILASNKNIALYVVPPLVLLLSSPKVEAKHLDGVRICVTGAGPVGGEDIAKVTQKKKITFVQAFGATEVTSVVLLSRNTSENYASSGIVVSNTMAKVVDINTGKSLPDNQEGELWFKGPQIMKEYLNNEVETKKMIDDEGWLRTGDIGYYDKNQDFYISDRLKELIKVKGFQVAPAELEHILRQHPDIYDAAVIGVPCPKNGEMPIAFIVPKSKERIPSEENVKKFVAEQVISYKKLRKVFVVEKIPRSPSGKILRRVLKNEYYGLKFHFK